MRGTAILWSRFRPRRSSPQPARRKWSRETAKVFDLVLKNDAPVPWPALSRFAEMPPHEEDVRPLLPQLEARALKDREGVRALGEFAFKLGLVQQLSAAFLAAWVEELAETDAFAALQVFKTARTLPLHLGVELYLRAKQPEAAAKLADQLDFVPPKLRRQLIVAFVRQNLVAAAQHWIDGWQATLPEDVSWLHHIAAQHNARLKLPEMPQHQAANPKIRIGESLQHLVSKLNEILATTPELLAQRDVHAAWFKSLTEPSRESLENLALEIARRATANWLPILRLVKSTTGRRILQLQPQLPPQAYAVVISRSKAQELPEILELMQPETFYSSEVLNAVAQVNADLFAEMSVPETQLSEHHLIALWGASNQPEWLFDLTLQHSSARLLRAALKTLSRDKGSYDRAAELLTNFVVRKGLSLDPKVLDVDRSNKLRKPEPHGLSSSECDSLITGALAKLYGLDH